MALEARVGYRSPRKSARSLCRALKMKSSHCSVSDAILVKGPACIWLICDFEHNRLPTEQCLKCKFARQNHQILLISPKIPRKASGAVPRATLSALLRHTHPSPCAFPSHCSQVVSAALRSCLCRVVIALSSFLMQRCHFNGQVIFSRWHA